MKAVVYAAEMAAIDRHAIEQLSIPGMVLMENAGRGIADVAEKMLGQPSGKVVHIYCGPGNNGGDGYVVARHLSNAGATVRVFIAADRDKIRGDALSNLVIWTKMGGALQFLRQDEPEPEQRPHLMVDALLGTGSSGHPSGLIGRAVEIIQSQTAPVLAVDIPTGVDANTGRVHGKAVMASVTATMALPKAGLLFSPGSDYAGRIEIIDIGIPPEVVRFHNPKTWLVDREDITSRLPLRARDAHKNQMGTVAVLAGSAGFTGAAALCASATLRAGCGLAYLCIPKSLQPVVAALAAEVITWPFDDQSRGLLDVNGYAEWRERIAGQDVIALGPGLAQEAGTASLVHQILNEMQKPLILDADGLNACAGQPALIKNYRGTMVLTPHPGELARLIGKSTVEIAADRIGIARSTASELGQVLVLKGGPTLIATPDGKVFINTTGNPGMATAGAGDVLTGTIAGLAAQGLNAADAALCGVYLHGLAGDLARLHKGEAGMVAGDILQQLPTALKTLRRS